MLDKPEDELNELFDQAKAIKGKAKAKSETATITPPNFQRAKVRIVGTAPLVLNKMSSESRRKMMANQEAGSRTEKGTKRSPKDFDAVSKGALHVSEDGWYGFPASGLRTALVDACRLVASR